MTVRYVVAGPTRHGVVRHALRLGASDQQRVDHSLPQQYNRRVPCQAEGFPDANDNDHAARTWSKSWANEEAGPQAWGHIQLMQMPNRP